MRKARWHYLPMTRREDISEQLNQIRSQIPSHIKLIVVTKAYPISDLEILYELGVRDFAENRDQEGAKKAPLLPSDITWHFQGQIQSNKIKSILSWADCINSLDSFDHAFKMNKQLSAPYPVFIQVSLDGQEHRGGVLPEKLDGLLDQIRKLKMINPIGLMAVAPLNEDPDSAFARLASIFSEISKSYPHIKYLSAGMSQDFMQAINHGATHIRLGSRILGNRK